MCWNSIWRWMQQNNALWQKPHLRNRSAGFPLPIGGFPMGRAGVGFSAAVFTPICSQTPLHLPPSENHGWGESKTGRAVFATMPNNLFFRTGLCGLRRRIHCRRNVVGLVGRRSHTRPLGLDRRRGLFGWSGDYSVDAQAAYTGEITLATCWCFLGVNSRTFAFVRHIIARVGKRKCLADDSYRACAVKRATPQKPLGMAPKDLTPGPSPDDKEQGRRQERGEKPQFSGISPSPERCFSALEREPGGEVGFGK
jgi:hypothetical protein